MVRPPSARTVRVADGLHVAAVHADHQPADAGVRHEHVRSAAEHRHRQADRPARPPSAAFTSRGALRAHAASPRARRP